MTNTNNEEYDSKFEGNHRAEGNHKADDNHNSDDNSKSEGTRDASSEADRATDAALEQDMNAVLKALEESKSKAEENWNLFLRARADIDNIRRRASRDVENAHLMSLSNLGKDLLAVVDSLEQGLTQAQSAGDNAYREGIELTLRLLLDTLEKHGIQVINPKGEAFNPKLHEAIATEQNSDVAANTVLVVAQKGFVLQERVLRPARVIVSA